MKKILLSFLIILLLFNTINIFNPVFANENPAYKVPLNERDGWICMSGGSSEGQLRFSRLQQYPQPFIDQCGRTMFPLIHFDELFRDGLSYKIDYNTITITKNVLDIITEVSVTIDSNILIRNGVEIVMDTSPIQRGEVIYIPLRWVGESLGYSISWEESRSQWWPGGAVEFNQFTSFFVYVWNESEDSLPNGLRYSYCISNEAADLSEIKANSTSDFEDVFDVIEKLPQGARVLTTALYSVKGYKVPYDIYDGITMRVFNGGYRSSYTTFCVDEIPPIIKDLDDFKNEWYSQELYALDEEALYHSEGQIYRFSYFPAFSNPIVVRMKIKDDGTAEINYKVGNGNAGAHSGGIFNSEKAELNKNETQEFIDLLITNAYWNLPKEIESLGLDGYEVVIEGIKHGEYHIINRWVPEKDDPVYNMQEYFFALIKQKFGEY